MKRCLALLTPFLLLASVGCDFRICNGTGDTLIFHIEDDNHRTVGAGQCDTMTPDREYLPVFMLYAKRSVQDGSHDIARRSVTVSEVFTFNGIRFIPSTGEPDLSSMRALELCNESGDDVQILPGDGDAFKSDGWIVDSGTTKPFITVAKGFERFIAVSADGKSELGDCEVALVDGVKVVWDGVDLTCADAGDPPDPTAIVELRNDSPIVDDVVLIVLTGQEPGDLDAINPDNFRFVEYPTGAALTFQAFDWNLLLRGECILNDPTFGDLVIWDGFELLCIDN